MNYGKSALAVAVAATLGGAMTAADAADHSVVLTNVKSYSNNGTSPANLTSSTATFHYDDVTNLVTQTGGTFEERYSIVENVSTLFRHTITGLVIGNGANAVGTTYVCTDGNFPLIFSHASFCGNLLLDLPLLPGRPNGMLVNQHPLPSRHGRDIRPIVVGLNKVDAGDRVIVA